MTIDNLRIDHWVTVLRDFTDAAGISVCAGTSGILRGLSFDQLRREIHIELEAVAGAEAGKIALLFPLAAQSGPRNGHMQEYFELGAYVPVERAEPAGHAAMAQRTASRPPPPKTARGKSDWWNVSAELDSPDRLEELENAMLKSAPYVGVCASIADVYAERMRAFKRAGDETRAIAAFKLAIHWMAANASQATSGGEGVALVRELKQFEAALVREFGYDPTLENATNIGNNTTEDNSR